VNRTALALLRPGSGAPASAWAARITACWAASREAVFEVGRLLIAAKEALAHGEFGKMIEADLPFSASTAQRLMAIAGDPKLADPAHVQYLPPAWGTLYELTKYSPERFEADLKAGKIRPDMERKEAINGARAIMGSREEPDDSLDFFPTPPWATRALIEVVLPQIGARADCSRQTAWDPASGEGHMTSVLRDYFRSVVSTDIRCYGDEQDGVFDFLEFDFSADPSNDWIITNPPFKKKTERFVLRAIDLAAFGVAMFVRLQWLETEGRYETIFKPHPPTLIAFFAERVNLCKGRWEPDGSTATAYIWLIWIHGKAPRPPFWIPPGQRERFTLAHDADHFTKTTESAAATATPAPSPSPAAAPEPAPSTSPGAGSLS
jgi:Protein of unknown function (DUF3102)